MHIPKVYSYRGRWAALDISGETSDGEIYQYYRKRKNKLLKRLKKEFADDFPEQKETG